LIEVDFVALSGVVLLNALREIAAMVFELIGLENHVFLLRSIEPLEALGINFLNFLVERQKVTNSLFRKWPIETMA
jgi:hypothetical protein